MEAGRPTRLPSRRKPRPTTNPRLWPRCRFSPGANRRFLEALRPRGDERSALGVGSSAAFFTAAATGVTGIAKGCDQAKLFQVSRPRFAKVKLLSPSSSPIVQVAGKF